MKIIDIFWKIKNGEKVPKKIRWYSTYYEYDENTGRYYDNRRGLLKISSDLDDLNFDVDVIEEVEDKEYEYIEELDESYYTSDSVKKINALIRNQKKILERIESGYYDKQSDNS